MSTVQQARDRELLEAVTTGHPVVVKDIGCRRFITHYTFDVTAARQYVASNMSANPVIYESTGNGWEVRP